MRSTCACPGGSGPIAAPERLRDWFEQGCEEQGLDAEMVLAEAVGPDTQVDDFWTRARTNLQARRVRLLLFVADAIPRELARIVEFLNGQMDPAEVLAIEVQQFVGEGVRTLVPRVIGRTAQAEAAKGERPRAKRTWDEASFYEDLRERHGEDHVRVARTRLEWGKRRSTRTSWGSAERSASFYPIIERAGIAHNIVYLNSQGRVTIPFRYMERRPPFDDPASRQEYRARLERAGFTMTGSPVVYPNIAMRALLADGAMERLIAVLDWASDTVDARDGTAAG